MTIFHAPALYLIVAIAIGYLIPLASAFATKQHWPTEVEGLLTLAFAAVTGLATDLIHAATSGADFSWRAWFVAAATALLSAAVAQSQTWRGSKTAAKLRGPSVAAVPAAPEPAVPVVPAKKAPAKKAAPVHPDTSPRQG